MIIQFPRKEYTLLKRREDYIEAFYEALAITAMRLNVDLDDWDDIFLLIREKVDNSLEIPTNEFRTSIEEGE